MIILRSIFRDPGALAVAGIMVFILTGASVYLPWLVSVVEALK